MLANDSSSIEKGIQLIKYEYQKKDIETLYLDYMSAVPINDADMTKEIDVEEFIKQDLRNKQLKNLFMHALNLYREKNQKPTVNDILKDMIKKQKQKLKMKKQRMMELLAKASKKKQKGDSKEEDENII